MKIKWAACTLFASMFALTACQEKPKSDTASEKEATQKNQVKTDTAIPLIQAKVERVQPKKDEVCHAAESSDDLATCTQYDLQTINTNVAWINTYFQDTIKKDHAEAFDDQPAVKVTLDSKIPSVNYSGASVRYIGQNYNIATFEYLVDYYPAGAAHGTYASRYVVIDLTQQHILTLNDILLPGAQEKLKDALYSYNSTWLDDHNIAVKDLNISENFYLGADGLVLVYPIYELASYAEGESELTIPYVELKNFVKAQYLPSLPEPRQDF